MQTMKTSELIKILKKAGCYKLRSGGSHDIWISPMTDKKFQVPRHGAKRSKDRISKRNFKRCGDKKMISTSKRR
ncbi:MAG: type II toxin-antitoxin system HicA family toxin [Dialister invisus]